MLFNEKLNKKSLAKKLAASGINLEKNRFVFFKQTCSTFDAQADIVAAASQTLGRGRLDRSFFSPYGGIYFCIKTKPMPLLTVSVAAGVMRALEAAAFSPDVKWVNDILVDGKKICGILCKSFSANEENDSFAVAGVGINYCIKNFPAAIENKAGSLFSSTKGINNFAALVIKEVISACRPSKTHENLFFYRERLAGIDKEIILPDGNMAIMTGIDDDGSLIYFKDGKYDHLTYGDIYL